MGVDLFLSGIISTLNWENYFDRNPVGVNTVRGTCNAGDS